MPRYEIKAIANVTMKTAGSVERNAVRWLNTITSAMKSGIVSTNAIINGTIARHNLLTPFNDRIQPIRNFFNFTR
jgi:hypothetical protein